MQGVVAYHLYIHKGHSIDCLWNLGMIRKQLITWKKKHWRAQDPCSSKSPFGLKTHNAFQNMQMYKYHNANICEGEIYVIVSSWPIMQIYSLKVTALKPECYYIQHVHVCYVYLPLQRWLLDLFLDFARLPRWSAPSPEPPGDPWGVSWLESVYPSVAYQ